MKRKLWLALALAVLAVLLCCGVASAASSGTCGEKVTWKLDDAGTLTISGTGSMADYGEDTPFGNNDDIHKIVIEKGVTRIGECAWISLFFPARHFSFSAAVKSASMNLRPSSMAVSFFSRACLALAFAYQLSCFDLSHDGQRT